MHILQFLYTKSDVLCDVGIELFQHDGASYVQHDLSILTSVDSNSVRPFSITASGGSTETIAIILDTSDVNLDPDGTVAMPILDFKIVIASPDIASNPVAPDNPKEIFM